jgi:hypothetical protein
MNKDEDSKDFAGKNGFTWFIGVIEDRQDPLKMGRVRVRCVGWHAENKMELPTEYLPWAIPSLPVNNANPYAPKEGDMVFGFFADGESAQSPIIVGVFPNIPLIAANAQKAFNDPRTNEQLSSAPVKPDETAINYPRKLDEPSTSRLARNDLDYPSPIVENKRNNKASKVEPDSYYSAKYPYNNVYESESGHALEFDDTKDAERIHLYHRSGSYVEWGPAGDRSERIQKDKFTVVVGDDSIYVQGDVNVYVDGDYNLNVTGDVKINGATINLNDGSKGAARVGDAADTGDPGGAVGSNQIESGSSTVFIGG